MSFEKPADDLRPKWLRGVQAEGTTQGTLTVGDKAYSYTLVRAGLEPRLPYTVGFPQNNALFVSVEADEFDRPHVMTHEIREQTDFFNLPEEERCQTSLKAELADVRAQASEVYSAYLNRRLKFFEALVNYYSDPVQAATKTPEFVKGLQASLEYLREETASLSV